MGTTKFKSKSWKGISTEFVPNGYKISHPETNTFVNAKDVVFDEISFLTIRPKLSITNLQKSYQSTDWLTDIFGKKKPEEISIPGKQKSGETPNKGKPGENPIPGSGSEELMPDMDN